MKSGRCYIAGAGHFNETVLPAKNDYVIAADAGYFELSKMNITPDFLIGDFDSIGFVPEIENVSKYPADKDDTDMMLAVKHGLDAGYKTFIINGGTGGRLDHTLANVQLLTFIAANGGRGYLIGESDKMTAITNSFISFSPMASGIVSVFAANGDAAGVDIQGMKYTLSDATLSPGVPLGVSNEFTGMFATVSVRSGTLLIVWSCGLDTVIKI